MFPGSTTEGIYAYSSGSGAGYSNFYYFRYADGVFTPFTSYAINVGTYVDTIVFNKPYNRFVALANGVIKLYYVCSKAACSSGGCDLNGNC